MKNLLNKLNFIIGILSVLLALILGKTLEEIVRVIFSIIQRIFAALPQGPVGRGFVDLIFESFMLELVSTATYCSVAIFLPD